MVVGQFTQEATLAIIGDFNDFLADRDKLVDEHGRPKESIHVSANPKYGSEKKGAPTTAKFPDSPTVRPKRVFSPVSVESSSRAPPKSRTPGIRSKA